eukprot:scaffold1154_cov310-Pinguiococcus_pyrenoidosus.AAC.34
MAVLRRTFECVPALAFIGVARFRGSAPQQVRDAFHHTWHGPHGSLAPLAKPQDLASRIEGGIRLAAENKVRIVVVHADTHVKILPHARHEEIIWRPVDAFLHHQLLQRTQKRLQLFVGVQAGDLASTYQTVEDL